MNKEQTNIEKNKRNTHRVIRGGFWLNIRPISAARSLGPPKTPSRIIGFRLILQTKYEK